jgi:pilus assembly protein CpaE
MQDLDSRSTVKRAIWGLAGELGLVAGAEPQQSRGSGKGGPYRSDKGSVGVRFRRGGGGARRQDKGTTESGGRAD